MGELVLVDSYCQAHLFCFVEEKLCELKHNKNEDNWMEFSNLLSYLNFQSSDLLSSIVWGVHFLTFDFVLL